MSTQSIQFIQAELKRLDLLLHREILRLRASYQLSLDEFRGLYISDQQVDNLINNSAKRDGQIPTIDELDKRAEELRRENMRQSMNGLPWQKITEEFQLSMFEQDVLLSALAPEIDLKYETLYAYLNNDITRKWPTVDLALRLFSSDESEKFNHCQFLQSESRLFQCGLLKTIANSQIHSHWLSEGYTISRDAARFILGVPQLESKSDNHIEFFKSHVGWEHIQVSDGLCRSLQKIPFLFQESTQIEANPVLVFEGRYGSGRREAAAAICDALEFRLIYLDLQALLKAGETDNQLFHDIVLKSRLTAAGVFINAAEMFRDNPENIIPDNAWMADILRFLKQVTKNKYPVFLGCSPGFPWQEMLKGYRILHFHFEEPGYDQRLKIWEENTQNRGHEVPDDQLHALADRFVLTAGQIRDAVVSAVDGHRLSTQDQLEHGSLQRECITQYLFEAARAQSGRHLGKLAHKVEQNYSWDDLVLPPAALRQVREVTAAIRNRYTVYNQWGFDQKLSTGNGLNVLFSGPSGTGKTMTAGVIAAELQLDLFKSDISSIVSRYVGDTEKNLDRIFRAAHKSNAILFFDEADALFGKRSEVKDAHDRYSNIEISYLLQKMEDHEGVVILASNLGKNIDKAFSRRMHYIVDFPLPEDKHREQIWHGMFPAQAPLFENVDFKFLARQFNISGGDIKNVALNAAFLASQDGNKITMELLIKSLAQQLIKQGRVPSQVEFREYFPLIGGNGK